MQDAVTADYSKISEVEKKQRLDLCRAAVGMSAATTLAASAFRQSMLD